MNNNKNRKTQIVATIGPRSERPEIFTTLLRAGVNIARTNMSHDDQSVHENRINTIREISKKEGIPVKILLDLSGPKIRIGDFKDGSVKLVEGSEFILTTTPYEGDQGKVFFNHPEIVREMKVGQIIMLDDGRRKLIVEEIKNGDLYTKVLVGGNIKGRRGVNLPNAFLSISALTEKDKKDLSFGIKMGVDYIALSFVRSAEDIRELRELIKKEGGNQKVIAKMETPESIKNIDEIISETDGVMVARGDLAIEIGHAKVPAAQKLLIEKSRAADKMVVVATQMLESMINAPVPTRAEVSDIARAVYEGADGVMLSEESALGEYALEAVSIMREVLEEVENSFVV